MDKWQAQQAFWESFGLPAYDDQTAFTEGDLPAYPHITYQSFGGSMGETATITASLWYKDVSWVAIKKKSDEIHRFIADNAPLAIKTDEGYLWIREGTAPFAQPADSGNDQIKRIVLTVGAESLSRY